MTGLKKFSMININTNSRLPVNAWIQPNVYYEFVLEIGPQIEIEKRRVISLPELFGEIGGLNDFITLTLVLILSSFRANAYLMDTINKLFLIGRERNL